MKEVRVITLSLLIFFAAALSFNFASTSIAKQSSLILPVLNSNDPSNVTVTILLGSGSNKQSPGYSPQNITVVIGLNNTVVWLNNDTAHHTVTSSTGAFSSGDLAPGQSYPFTFTEPGIYKYYCAYHSWMSGSVVVTAPIPEFPSPSLILLASLLIIASVFASLQMVRRRHNRAKLMNGSMQDNAIRQTY